MVLLLFINTYYYYLSIPGRVNSANARQRADNFVTNEKRFKTGQNPWGFQAKTAW